MSFSYRCPVLLPVSLLEALGGASLESFQFYPGGKSVRVNIFTALIAVSQSMSFVNDLTHVHMDTK